MANRVAMICSTALLSSPNTIPHIGTGFCLLSPRIIVTAKHVLENYSDLVVIATSEGLFDRTSIIHKHPIADIAAIVVSKSFAEKLEMCELISDSARNRDVLISEDVMSYGFPQLGNEMPIPARVLKGHIMRKYNDEISGNECFEVAMPAFFGQSGSPILLDSIDDERYAKAIGIVSSSVSVSSEKNKVISG